MPNQVSSLVDVKPDFHNWYIQNDKGIIWIFTCIKMFNNKIKYTNAILKLKCMAIFKRKASYFFHVPRNIRKLLKYWIIGFEHPFHYLLHCLARISVVLFWKLAYYLLMTLSAEQINGVELPLTSPAAVLYLCFYWAGSCNGEPVLWNISSSASFYNVVI